MTQMKILWNIIGMWSQKTFAPDKDRNGTGPLKHLMKELLVELLGFDEKLVSNLTVEAGSTITKLRETQTLEQRLKEYADLQILIFDAARRDGFSFEQLQAASHAKMIINQKRSYPKTKGDEVSEHDRSLDPVEKKDEEEVHSNNPEGSPSKDSV